MDQYFLLSSFVRCSCLLLDKTVDNNPIELLSTDQLVQLDPSTVQSSVQLSCTINNNVGYEVVHAVRQQKRKHHYPDLVLMIIYYVYSK